MSVMRDDDQIEQHPSHSSHLTHLSDLVGRGVAYEQGDVAPRHGTIVSANYSLSGETVMVVHPDSRPSEILANTVLMGHQANWALEHLDSAEPLSVDEAARRRLNAGQARAVPEAPAGVALHPVCPADACQTSEPDPRGRLGPFGAR